MTGAVGVLESCRGFRVTGKRYCRCEGSRELWSERSRGVQNLRVGGRRRVEKTANLVNEVWILGKAGETGDLRGCGGRRGGWLERECVSGEEGERGALRAGAGGVGGRRTGVWGGGFVQVGSVDFVCNYRGFGF